MTVTPTHPAHPDGVGLWQAGNEQRGVARVQVNGAHVVGLADAEAPVGWGSIQESDFAIRSSVEIDRVDELSAQASE